MQVERRRFEVIASRSAVLIEARSSVGPIAFGTTAIAGFVEVNTRDGGLDIDGAAPAAHLDLDLTTLSSGNSVYDAELLRRIDVRQYPATELQLQVATRIGQADRYDVEGDLSFHGHTRRISGTVRVEMQPNGSLLIRGEHLFDIRDYRVAAPTMLMLRIYPDVRVELQLEAAPAR